MFDIDNQFIRNLLNIKFEFIEYKDKYKVTDSRTHLFEFFGEHLDKIEQTISFYCFNEELLQNKLLQTDNLEELNKYKMLCYEQIIELIHELNHATGFSRFCKLSDEKYIPINKQERKTLIENDFVYREKSGIIIGRCLKTGSQKSIAKNLLYEALTEVLSHNIMNSPNFDDIQFLNINSKRKNSYSLSFSYEPISTIILLFSYLDENLFSAYFSSSNQKKTQNIWNNVYEIAQPLCFSYYDLKHLNPNDNLEELLKTLVQNIKEIINYFNNALHNEKLSEKNQHKIAFEIENSLTNKKFWQNSFYFLDNELLSKALENLTNPKSLKSKEI